MKNVMAVVVFVVIAVVFVGIGVLRKGGDEEKPVKVAVIPKGTASVYWELVRVGAVKACDELGYEMSWNGPELETDRERQIQIINDFIAQKVDGVVLAPNDSSALVPVVEKMYDRGLPCVIVDSGINTDKVLSFASTDNYKGGAIAAKRMGEILGGKGNIIVVKFVTGSDSTELRISGFTETIKKEFPGITIVDSQFGGATDESALSVVEDMLTKNSDVDGLFSCNASTTRSSAQALKSTGRADGIKMVGFDADEMLIENLESGVIDALIVQDPVKMGYLGVKMIAAKLNGEQVEKNVDTGVWLIKKEDLEKPEIQELLNLK